MATSRQPLQLSEPKKELMRVYKGSRAMTGSQRGYGAPYAPILPSNAMEDYYHDITGKEVTDFDPKTHTIVGTIGEGGQRIDYPTNEAMPSWMPKFSPQYSGPMAKAQPYAGPMARTTDSKPLNLGSYFKNNAVGVKPSTQVTPSDVKANASAIVPTKSIAEEQADYIRKRGGRTAADADAEAIRSGMKNYQEMTGFDISTEEGRRQSQNAALLRGGHAKAMTYYDKGGQYDQLRDAAVKKHWEGDNWVGNNPVTGAFRDPATGEEWGSEQAFRFNQKTTLTNPTQEDIADNVRKNFDVTTTPPANQTYAYPSQIGPTNGPENMDFGPLRKAARNYRLGQSWKSATTGPTDYAGLSELVRNNASADAGFDGVNPLQSTQRTRHDTGFMKDEAIGPYGGSVKRAPSTRPVFNLPNQNLVRKNPFKR